MDGRGTAAWPVAPAPLPHTSTTTTTTAPASSAGAPGRVCASACGLRVRMRLRLRLRLRWLHFDHRLVIWCASEAVSVCVCVLVPARACAVPGLTDGRRRSSAALRGRPWRDPLPRGASNVLCCQQHWNRGVASVEAHRKSVDVSASNSTPSKAGRPVMAGRDGSSSASPSQWRRRGWRWDAADQGRAINAVRVVCPWRRLALFHACASHIACSRPRCAYCWGRCGRNSLYPRDTRTAQLAQAKITRQRVRLRRLLALGLPAGRRTRAAP